MQQLAQYSGNTSSPVARNILKQEHMDPRDYVRLYTTLGLNGGTNLPTLWAFLLIVLAIVLFIIFATSFSMHIYQRRSRRALERRIRSGEVGIEDLGIRRLRVPQEAVNNLPTFIYVPDESNPIPSDRSADPISQAPSGSAIPASSIPDHAHFSQFNCSICLDDFIPRETRVRALPCHHIYHPECIDKILLDSSSLCPLCKQRVIPQGQPPYPHEPVTNAMVRYDRRARRLRDARDMRRAQNRTVGSQGGDSFGRFTGLRRACGRDRRTSSAPSAARTAGQIEMAEVGSRAVSSPIAASNPEAEATQNRPPADSTLRTEWLDRRRDTLVEHQPTLEEAEAERRARMPRCKTS